MRIRLGYVAIALNLDKVTSSSTLTYSRYLKMDEEKYSNITCVLYEQVDNTKTEISKSNYEGTAITLNEYLENVEFNIDDYESTCKYYTEDSLSIELKATEQDGKIITYEIPLVLNDNCDSTSS